VVLQAKESALEGTGEPMGLDVIAFEHATPVRDHLDQTECDEHYVADADGFPQSFRGLEDGRCYELSGRQFGFRAGSYSGYNMWPVLLLSVRWACQPTSFGQI
jgi:hypothetical protein